MFGLAQVILTGYQGIPKSLANDVLKVRVHVDMRAQPVAKAKPYRSGPSRVICRLLGILNNELIHHG
jgi:hypothetical protein